MRRPLRCPTALWSPALVSLLFVLAFAVPRTTRAGSASGIQLPDRFDSSLAVVGANLLVAGGSEFVRSPDAARATSIDSDEVDIVNTDSGASWTAQLSVPRSHMSVAIVGSRVVFAGGYDHDPETGADRSSAAVDVYDSATDEWSVASLSDPRDTMAVAVVGTQVLFAGGGHLPPTGFSSAVDVYDAASGSWSATSLTRAESAYLQPTAPVLKTVRVPPLLPALSAWTVGTQVLFVEGAAARGWTVDIYDSTTGNWSNHDPGLDDIIQVVVSGQRGVLVGTSAGAARAMVYDAANSQWTSAAIVSPHVGGAAAVLGSRVVLAGGTPDQACTSGDAVDIYDTTDGRWSSAHLSAGRARGMRVVQVADQLLFAGGETCSGVSDRVDIYDGATDRWTSTTLSQARTEITAVAVGTRAILAGGLKPREGWVNGETTDAVDVYDAATGRWTAAHLAEPRVAIAPAVLGTRVLLAGGERPPQFSRRPYEPSALIDVFDASTATWTSDTLSDARAGALVLQLGPRVLFVGGQTDCFACGPRHSLAVDIFALS